MNGLKKERKERLRVFLNKALKAYDALGFY